MTASIGNKGYVTMDLERRLNRIKNRIGLVGGPLILTEVSDSDSNISASIDPKDWHIELRVKRDWNPAPDRQTRNYLKQKNESDALWAVARDVVYHECGHWALPRGSKNGCPRSPELHDVILDAVVKARSEKGRERNEQAEHYIANSFEDLLDNTFCTGQTSHSGQALFYNDQGLNAENRKFGDFYEAFVKLNLFCWGGKNEERLLGRFYNNNENVISAVKQVIDELGLKQKSTLNGRQNNDGTCEQITYNDKDKVIEAFQNETNWHDMAFEYTKIMEDLMSEEMPKEQLFGVGNPNQTGEGQEKQSSGKKKEEGNAQPGNKKKSGGSAFDKKLEGDKDKVIVQRFKAGKGKSSYMDSFEYLDSLYRTLGREIPVKVELFRQAHSFPVAHYGNQAFDPEVHDMAMMKLSRLGVDEHGSIAFQTHQGDISIPEQYVKNLRGFPNLRVVNLDTSGSMKSPLFGSDVGMIVNPFAPEEQRWGVNSKYHKSLTGKYGIDAYFDMQGIAGEVDLILINVSSSSLTSEKQTLGSRTEENRLALSPQFGGTNMDCDVLEESLGTEPCFVMSLSDGEFQNWNTTKSRFKEIISKHAYAHIHMGNANRFTTDLQEWNIPVYFVNQENPLEKLMVDVTQTYYQKFALEAIQNA